MGEGFRLPSPGAAHRPLPQAGEVKVLHFARLPEKVDRAKREPDEGSVKYPGNRAQAASALPSLTACRD